MDTPAIIKYITSACNHYENMKKAQTAYYERKRQDKKESGTYRGRGRPRKVIPSDESGSPPNLPVTQVGQVSNTGV
jgi:hypothetical protein